jgi:hypothetical protein
VDGPAVDSRLRGNDKPVADPRDLEDLAQIQALMAQPRSAGGNAQEANYLQTLATLIEKAP